MKTNAQRAPFPSLGFPARGLRS